MTYTSLEIINIARKLTQTDNSKAFDYQLLIHLLNNAYTGLYNDLSDSQAFTGTFTFSGDKCVLPRDCHKIINVVRVNSNINYRLSAMGKRTPGTYTVMNGVLEIENGNYEVYYTKMPSILTINQGCEFPIIDIDYSYTPWMDYEYTTGKHYIYYKKDAKYFEYCIEDESEVEKTKTRPTRSFQNKSVNVVYEDDVVVSVEIGGEDMSDLFITENPLVGFYNDNEHIVLTYIVNNAPVLYTVDSNYSFAEINPWLYRGKHFNFIGCDICTDDSTGGYLLFTDGHNIGLTSYLPDTVLEFPENTFFDVLIDRVAVMLAGLCGVADIEMLKVKLEQDEKAFYSSITRSEQGFRIQNVN